ncbi:MAG: tol-pal system-associated acyl-CoA thioesterase [Alphaproteobacteria bacterium]
MTDLSPPHPATGYLQGSWHILPLRVYYEDTDAAGIVYHAAYLHYAERGRTEAMRLCGLNHGRLAKEQGLHFAVHRCEIDYHRPARLDDALEVRTQIATMGGASFTVHQTIHRQDKILANLTIRLVCIDGQGHAVRLPLPLREALRVMYAEPLLGN